MFCYPNLPYWQITEKLSRFLLKEYLESNGGTPIQKGWGNNVSPFLHSFASGVKALK